MSLKMPAVAPAQHRFSMVPRATIERSVFDRSHPYKTTFNAGYLIPIFVDDALPGDTYHLQLQALARLATPLKPIMDNLYLESFWFFVPLRLVWDNFKKFMGEQVTPGDSTAYTIPKTTVPAAGYNVGVLEDYMGIPTGIPCTAASWTHSALYVRAFQLIYNEWFRDENLEGPYGVSKGDGPDVPAAGGTPLIKRGKRHDYFTSALPWPQKGTAVSIPVMTGVLPVYAGTGTTAIGVGLASAPGTPKFLNDAGANNIQASASTGGTPLAVDVSGASMASINQLRQSFQVQKLLERDARGGTRYTEIVRSHFGVISPDARLQRPEYLGGGSTPVVVHPVPQMTQTGVTGSTTPQGNLAGYGTASVSGHGFAKSFTEHGIVMGIINVRADLTYQQGLERQFSRSTRYDFFWPALAHIGEQSILNQELYLADNASQNAATFGYQERYAEYRYKPGKVTGLFRSNAAGTLHVWHLAENFGALPTLNSTFIEDQTSTILDRVNAVGSEPDFLLDAWIQLKQARPMPVYGVPGMIDHF